MRLQEAFAAGYAIRASSAVTARASSALRDRSRGDEQRVDRVRRRSDPGCDGPQRAEEDDDGVTERLIDAKAAGELLSVPHTWVLEQARHDRIPHVRLGRYVRFDARRFCVVT